MFLLKRSSFVILLMLLLLANKPSLSAKTTYLWQWEQERHTPFSLHLSNLEISALPVVNEPLEMVLSVTSQVDVPHFQIELNLPETVILEKGNLQWEDTLVAGETKQYVITVRVLESGEHFVSATLFAHQYTSSAIDGLTVVFSSQPEQATIYRFHEYPRSQEEPVFQVAPENIQLVAPAVAGTIQLKGQVTYEAKIGDCFDMSCVVLTSGLVLERAKVQLWDREGLSHRLLAEGYLSAIGEYHFTVPNKDPDGTGIDPFVKILATDDSRVKVVDPYEYLYTASFHFSNNMGDGIHRSNLNFTDTSTGTNISNFNQAFYGFDLLSNDAYNYINKNSNWSNPDMVEVNWPYACIFDTTANSCYFNEQIYMHLNDGVQPDTFIHEYSHFVLSRFTGNSNVILACAIGFQHYFEYPSSSSCAWSEGWANFMQAAVQNDGDYRGLNFETPTIWPGLDDPNGSHWELMVAAALWDIFDAQNELFDTLSDGLNPTNGIWHISTQIDGTEFNNGFVSFFDDWAVLRGNSATCPLAQEYRFFAVVGVSTSPLAGGYVQILPSSDCFPLHYLNERSVSLTAVSNPNYAFSEWSGNIEDWVSGSNTPNILTSLVTVRTYNITASFTDFSPTPTPSAPIQIEKRINSSQDDAGWGYPNGSSCSYATNHREIYFGNCNGVPSWAGFRFTDLNVPRNANIIDAYIVFTVDGPYSNPVQVKFYGENTGFATPFDSSPIGNRPTTTNSVTWMINESWVVSQQKNSPSLKNIVQEIVNRPDWVSGSAMAFLVEDNGTAVNTHRRVVGYDRLFNPPGPQNAAKLVIIYQ